MKITKKPLYLMLCSLVVTMAGCGGGGGGGSSSPLIGDWRGPCELDGNLSTRETLTLTGSTFEITSTLFADTNCGTQGFARVNSGTYTEGDSEELEGRGSVTDIDIVVTAVSETWFLEGDINNLNAGAVCGITNWTAGVNVDISDCADRLDGQVVPENLFDIYLVEDDELYFGSTAASNTAAERPATISAIPEFNRI